MRLPKTFYTIHETKGELLGHDHFGRPVYGEPSTEYREFKGELEPYSSKLAETNYGLFVQVTNRLFCEPNPNIFLTSKVLYEEEVYTVTEYLTYDKHFEVLIKKGGA